MNEFQLRECSVLNSILDIKKMDTILDGHANYIELSGIARNYNLYTSGSIEEVDFQNEAVKSALAALGIWCAELAPGSGKTIIEAKVALDYINKEKKALFVCPNGTALGDERSGIIQGFHRAFKFYQNGKVIEIGRKNKLSKKNDINFVTPRTLLNYRAKSPNFFSAIINSSDLLIVDESHHFPEDKDGDLKIFGEIITIARDLFVKNNKKVIGLTGTHGRMDSKIVMGIMQPLYTLTVQDAVNKGRCPEIFGIQVFIDVKCPNSKLERGFYNLHLDKQEYHKYWDLVSECMISTWKKFPKPTCAFVRTIQDAHQLVNQFNQKSNLANKGLVVLSGKTPGKVRDQIISKILNGELLGYVTCSVGEESINIPPLEIVHLIRRSKSINKNAQAIGRSLRLHPEKKRSLIVDYQVMKANIIKSCKGLINYAEESYSINPDLFNGGPLIFDQQNQDIYSKVMGIKISDETAWIMKELNKNEDKNSHLLDLRMEIQNRTKKEKEAIIEMAKSGYFRPDEYNNDDFFEFKGEKIYINSSYSGCLCRTFEQFLNDGEFINKLKEIRPDWFLLPFPQNKKMRYLLSLVESGKDLPAKWSDEVFYLQALTDKLKKKKILDVSESFFLFKLMSSKPGWFQLEKEGIRQANDIWKLVSSALTNKKIALPLEKIGKKRFSSFLLDNPNLGYVMNSFNPRIIYNTGGIKKEADFLAFWRDIEEKNRARKEIEDIINRARRSAGIVS